MQKREITIKSLFEKLSSGELANLNNRTLHLEGWVKTNRDNGKVGFIEFNDGTFFNNIQLVYGPETEDYEKIASISTGSSVSVDGNILLTPENKQPFEIQLLSLSLLGDVEEGYLLQKKRHSFEFLRDIAHLRPRTNTFNAVFRIRSQLTFAIHEFFHNRNFIYVHTPEITINDAEGAGEAFKIVTSMKKPDEYFGHLASLTVSGQLHVEPFALTYRDVYTFGPTFRAEKSNTARHACEFWMIEPEIAFADLEDDMNLIEDCLKYVIKYVMEHNKEEMNFFNQFIDKTLIERLKVVLNSPFVRLTYTEGIELLKKAKENGVKFENPNIEWGMDLQSEHEKYLTEVIIKGPMFLIDYPKEIKAFYMRLNDDNKTVAACDLLVPGIGELVGGSQREERLDLLTNKMEELGNKKELEWYLDTRRYGGCKHAGFGIGFDRLIMYVTGISNIRDVQPYPRTFGNIKY